MSLDTSTTSRGACWRRRAPHAQDLVVGLALGQAGGELEIQGRGLEEQAARAALACGVELEALAHVGALGGGQGVQRPADLAAVAATSVMPFLWASSSSSTIMGR